MQRKHLLLFLLLLPVAFANSQDLAFRHLSAEEGLSQNTINCIYQDHFGFMWFGTQDGLNCYDGYEINIFRNNPADSSSLSHNWIWDIIEDDSLNLWIATWNGLTKFDRIKNRFVRFMPDSSNLHSISGSRPASIAKDSVGKLWIGTWGGGLNVYDPVNENFMAFRGSVSTGKDYPGDFIRVVFADKKGDIWIGSWNGLWKCTEDENGELFFAHFINDPSDPGSISSNKITSMGEEADGTLWIGTLGGGINRYDKPSKSFTRFQANKNDPSAISGNDIASIEIDPKGELWIGTVSNGLNRFNREKQSFITYNHDPMNLNSLSSDAVYSIYADNSGVLWVGAGGMNIYDSKLSKFQCFGPLKKLRDQLINESVDVLFEDQNGILWAGTNRGLVRMDTQNGKLSWYRHDPEDIRSISHNEISSIAEDNYGNIWIATRGGGLNKFNSSSEGFMHIMEQRNNPETVGLNYISAMAFDDNGILWVATSDNGITSFDQDRKKYQNFKSDLSDPTTISGNYLLRLFKDSNGDIWIGTWGAGLNKLDVKNYIFTRYLNDPENPASIPGNIVHSINESNADSTRTIWIGTANGLTSFNPEIPSDGFKSLSINSKFPSQSIYGILPDAHKNLWISSNAGISMYNPNEESLKNYNIRNGLPGNEFNAGAFLELKSGQFAFGCINGLLIFHPDSIFESSFQPKIALTSFSIFSEKIFDGRHLNANESLYLTYKQNFFSFEFASMDYSDPERNSFMYRMEGIDDDWIESGNRHYASYTKIDPGHYEFIVKGTNSDEIWSSNEARINLIIAPPFWQKWWFRVCIIVIIILLLYSLHLYRVNKIREIERLRIRIASDLHDDIGSALTRISVHSQQILTSREDEKIRMSSNKINDLSREVISTMSDVVWSIDARNDTLSDLLTRMQDFTHNALSEKDIRVSFEQIGMDSGRHIPVLERQNIFYIFKEAINNIVKHSEATEVKISIQNIDSHFKMRIADNGKGYDTEKIRRGNGIRNMNMRAERIGATIEIQSNSGVVIKLKMNRL